MQVIDEFLEMLHSQKLKLHVAKADITIGSVDEWRDKRPAQTRAARLGKRYPAVRKAAHRGCGWDGWNRTQTNRVKV